jgi:hypothetical protein
VSKALPISLRAVMLLLCGASAKRGFNPQNNAKIILERRRKEGLFFLSVLCIILPPKTNKTQFSTGF